MIIESIRRLIRGAGQTVSGAVVGIGAAVGAQTRRARGLLVVHSRRQMMHAEVLPACPSCGSASFDTIDAAGRRVRTTEICACGATRPPIRQLGRIWEKKS